MHRLLPLAVALALALPARTQPHPTRLWTSSEILLELKKAAATGTVLYVAAHPDDENTALIAYLAQVRHLRTGYLSLTRGDGGQNLIGPELGDGLGVIRTQELLAARSIDGGQQFFTRARDFGYSKTVAETLRFWDKDSVLADMVWVLRTFRPDVIVTRFTPDEDLFDTHGHHTASAQLALEAAAAAADPTRFADQLTHPGVTPWRVKRVYWNGFPGFVPANKPEPNFLKLEIGTYQPLLGKDAGELAAESRSMHKSQGFGSARVRGSRTEYFAPLWGDTAYVTDPFQGIEWAQSRYWSGGSTARTALQAAIEAFDPLHPEASLPQLLEAHQWVAQIPQEGFRQLKLRQIETLIRHCAGVWVEAYTAQPTYTPGAPVQVLYDALTRYPGLGVTFGQLQVLAATGTAVLGSSATRRDFALSPSPVRDTIAFDLPATVPLATPFWLRAMGTFGRFRLPGQAFVGRPAPEPLLRAVYSFRLGEFTVFDTIPVVYKQRSATDGDVYQPVELLPPVTITPAVEALVFGSAEPQQLRLRVQAHRTGLRGRVELELPQGWRREWLTPPSLPTAAGQEVLIDVLIHPGTQSGQARPVVLAEDGTRNEYALQRITYAHLPRQTLLRPARVQLARVEVACTARRIGYIAGAGDQVAESLQAMGLTVEVLDEATLASGNLAAYDAILVGIRAYNAVPRMAAWHARLTDYAQGGGTLVVQYQTASGFRTAAPPPGWQWPIVLGRGRVTDETAPITTEAHPILQQPNALSATDFEGWVQERGLYFADSWPEGAATPLSLADPGEAPQRGGLVVLPTGKGVVIYTGLSFFRQLPAGVPGAYRLLANLLSYRPNAN